MHPIRSIRQYGGVVPITGDPHLTGDAQYTTGEHGMGKESSAVGKCLDYKPLNCL